MLTDVSFYNIYNKAFVCSCNAYNGMLTFRPDSPHIDLVGVAIAGCGVVVVRQRVLGAAHHHQLGHEVQEQLANPRRHVVRRGRPAPQAID